MIPTISSYATINSASLNRASFNLGAGLVLVDKLDSIQIESVYINGDPLNLKS